MQKPHQPSTDVIMPFYEIITYSAAMQANITSSIDSIQAVYLALIQGMTEFLPISSSAHLALLPLLSNWPDQGLAFDCVVHLGSLTAVIIYFRSDIARMAAGFGHTIGQRSITADRDGYMAWLIGFATIPVGLFGLTFKDMIETDFRSLTVVGVTSIVFGLLLWLADSEDKCTKNETAWTFRDAMIVGLAQAIALIPGTSRALVFDIGGGRHADEIGGVDVRLVKHRRPPGKERLVEARRRTGNEHVMLQKRILKTGRRVDVNNRYRRDV